jgi:ABC-type proline/glycine betaine transport system ATPase subunit
LARAVYSDCNIMLMDDPISALDSNVKKKIFKNVFLSKFSSKTRILVTHAVDFLHLVDTIILLKKGEIVLKGNYNELKDSPYLKEVIGIHKFNKKTEEEVKLIQTSLNSDTNLESENIQREELINLDDLESSIDSLD